MSLKWVTQQLQIAVNPSRAGVERLTRFNPRPEGVIQQGGATEAVLAYMQLHPRRWFRHYEITHAVTHSRVAVDWALIRLKSYGLIESVSDEGRNSRYLRYRLKQGATK
jgi:hypothetical protein